MQTRRPVAGLALAALVAAGTWLVFGRTADASSIPVGQIAGLVAAMPAAQTMTTDKDGFTCPPVNLAGAANTNAKLIDAVGGDYAAFDLENESATAVHICGANAGFADGGIAGATEIAAACPKRCSTCLGGTVYAPDVKQRGYVLSGTNAFPNAYCFSAGADAGVIVRVNYFR